MVKEKTILDVGDFGAMTNDSLAEHGIPRGSVVYLAGFHWARSETNVYNYRKVFVGALVENGHINLEKKAFLVDGKNLRKLKGKRLENLKKTYDEDFSPKEQEAVNEVPN